MAKVIIELTPEEASSAIGNGTVNAFLQQFIKTGSPRLEIDNDAAEKAEAKAKAEAKEKAEAKAKADAAERAKAEAKAKADAAAAAAKAAAAEAAAAAAALEAEDTPDATADDDAEDGAEDGTTYTLEEVRAALAALNKAGKNAMTKEILAECGATQLTAVDPAKYAYVMKRAKQA